MTVAWKDEGPRGPVWIDDALVTGPLGEPIWFTEAQAAAIARALDAKFTHA
jgi:hypothetical protein